MRTVSCDFIFRTVHSSAVQDHSISVDSQQAGADIKPNALPRRTCSGGFRSSRWPSRVEQTKQFVGNEPASRGVDVAIPVRALAMGEETLGPLSVAARSQWRTPSRSDGTSPVRAG